MIDPLYIHCTLTDFKLMTVCHETERVDSWWGIIKKSGQYPALSKVAIAACTIFHGPMVESSFNTMGDIMDLKSSNMAVETYYSIQTVKYFIKSRETTATKLFRRDDFLYGPVDRQLTRNMMKSSSTYSEGLKKRNHDEMERINKLQEKRTSEMDSKKKAKLTLQAEAEKDLQANVKKQANQARLRILKALVEKRKSKQ